MTNAPKTDLDPSAVRLRIAPGDWADLGQRIRRAAARAALISLLEDAMADAAGDSDTKELTP